MKCGLVFLTLLASASAHAADWSEEVKVRRGRDVVATYRAQVRGDALVVEVTHAAGWHTYSMDNLVRARAATGKEKPDTELPTRIAVEGGLKIAGPWHQTPPKDLTNLEIKWYTWGFDETATFAAKVERTGNGETATVRINAQACNESSCAMVDDLELTVAIPPAIEDNAAIDWATLVQVKFPEEDQPVPQN